MNFGDFARKIRDLRILNEKVERCNGTQRVLRLYLMQILNSEGGTPPGQVTGEVCPVRRKLWDFLSTKT